MLIKATTQYFSHKLRHIVKKNDYKQNLVSKTGISPSLHTAFTMDSYYQKKKKNPDPTSYIQLNKCLTSYIETIFYLI